ncbi:hypothetical protein V8017_01660 [Stenotrophomonas rhizophila]
MNKLILAAALATALVSTPAFAADLSAADVQAKLRAAGYTRCMSWSATMACGKQTSPVPMAASKK